MIDSGDGFLDVCPCQSLHVSKLTHTHIYVYMCKCAANVRQSYLNKAERGGGREKVGIGIAMSQRTVRRTMERSLGPGPGRNLR